MHLAASTSREHFSLTPRSTTTMSASFSATKAIINSIRWCGRRTFKRIGRRHRSVHRPNRASNWNWWIALLVLGKCCATVCGTRATQRIKWNCCGKIRGMWAGKSERHTDGFCCIDRRSVWFDCESSKAKIWWPIRATFTIPRWKVDAWECFASRKRASFGPIWFIDATTMCPRRFTMRFRHVYNPKWKSIAIEYRHLLCIILLNCIQWAIFICNLVRRERTFSTVDFV